MLIKVCGMRDASNIEKVASLHPDFMGFIFYPKSPRFACELTVDTIRGLSSEIKKVGVFVNEEQGKILEVSEKYNIRYIQLHGMEKPEFCAELKEQGFYVIKAVGIEKEQDLTVCKYYEPYCDMFVFDTKSLEYGGTGRTFNWDILKNYDLNLPFLLSGGISEENVKEVLEFTHPQCLGVDINSRFETVPGMKDVVKLKKFFELINKNTNE